MGDINMDMSKSGLFAGITYACAAVGATVGALNFGAGIAGTVVAGAAGAVVGGVCLPAAGVLVGIGVYAFGKALVKSVKETTPFLALGTFVIAASSAKALFVTPVVALRRLAARATRPQGNDAPAATGDVMKKSVFAKISSAFAKVAGRRQQATPTPTAPDAAPKP